MAKKTATKSSNGATSKNRIADPPFVAEPAEAVISVPNLRVVKFEIEGISSYMQNKFSEKAKEAIRKQQEAGGTAKSKKKREPKDFEQVCDDATHYSQDGWRGIPAPAFRSAMISACRVAGFVMTRARLAVHVIEDGRDRDDGTPLVEIIGEPVMDVSAVRPQKGVMDLAARPRWDDWWAVVTVRYDADMFQMSDVYNLLVRAGMQVGIGCGRPDSSDSCGTGFGLFNVKPVTDEGV